MLVYVFLFLLYNLDIIKSNRPFVIRENKAYTRQGRI